MRFKIISCKPMQEGLSHSRYAESSMAKEFVYYTFKGVSPRVASAQPSRVASFETDNPFATEDSPTSSSTNALWALLGQSQQTLLKERQAFGQPNARTASLDQFSTHCANLRQTHARNTSKNIQNMHGVEHAQVASHTQVMRARFEAIKVHTREATKRFHAVAKAVQTIACTGITASGGANSVTHGSTASVGHVAGHMDSFGNQHALNGAGLRLVSSDFQPYFGDLRAYIGAGGLQHAGFKPKQATVRDFIGMSQSLLKEKGNSEEDDSHFLADLAPIKGLKGLVGMDALEAAFENYAKSEVFKRAKHALVCQKIERNAKEKPSFLASMWKSFKDKGNMIKGKPSIEDLWKTVLNDMVELKPILRHNIRCGYYEDSAKQMDQFAELALANLDFILVRNAGLHSLASKFPGGSSGKAMLDTKDQTNKEQFMTKLNGELWSLFLQGQHGSNKGAPLFPEEWKNEVLHKNYPLLESVRQRILTLQEQ